ncbi:MAG: nicotinate-nucleotide adenylyltransferase [Rubellimicrobium sp.]|nr:nicotinate-nucleotide adenylyltransferase [Rubellimicrobium sp.]
MPVFSARPGVRMPLALPGQVIGLMGGSFDPAHEGHVQITSAALARFALDQVWWLVSPGNPLKAHGPAPLERRLAAASALMRHPRVHVTDLEAQIGTRTTARTLRWLVTRAPGVRFVWLMGADNLAQFHRWQDWESILHMVPVGVLARPGHQMAAQFSRAARMYRGARLPDHAARLLGRTATPAWCYVTVPMSPLSSTRLRAAGVWTPSGPDGGGLDGVTDAGEVMGRTLPVGEGSV